MSDRRAGKNRGVSRARMPEQDMKAFAARSLLAMQEWLKPFGEKFYSIGYLMMFMQLIIKPGISRGKLALFLEVEAHVSRSTAERFISAAAKAGYIEIKNKRRKTAAQKPKNQKAKSKKPKAKEAQNSKVPKEIRLSAKYVEHFSNVFKTSGERAKIMYKPRTR